MSPFNHAFKKLGTAQKWTLQKQIEAVLIAHSELIRWIGSIADEVTKNRRSEKPLCQNDAAPKNGLHPDEDSASQPPAISIEFHSRSLPLSVVSCLAFLSIAGVRGQTFSTGQKEKPRCSRLLPRCRDPSEIVAPADPCRSILAPVIR
jgi:hypothetical protein